MNSRYDILIPVLMAVVLLAAGCSGETTADFEEEDVRAFVPAVNSVEFGAFPYSSVGFYITGETVNTVYPGAPANGGVLNKVNGVWKTTPTTKVSNTRGRLYAWYPSGLALTPDMTGGNHTVPVSVPASQTSVGAVQQSATDYLYGSGSDAVASSTPVVVGTNVVPNSTIYMQHAMAQVVFNVKYDARDASDNNYVKKITLTTPNALFFVGNGTMKVADGTLSGLGRSSVLSFAPVAGNEQSVGETPATVASGLVAPLDVTPVVTLTVVMGQKGKDTKDRTYTLTSSAINVKWERGRCYIYNLKLGNTVTVSQTTVAWSAVSSSTTVSTKERGIGSFAEFTAFAKSWNENGDQGDKNAEFYKDYGWEEIDGNGNKVFTIKLIKSFPVTATVLDAIFWQPVGSVEKPLNIPFDGQGWTIYIDLTGIIGTTAPIARLSGSYAGIIGYTRKDIRNVCVVNGGLSGLGSIVTSTLKYVDAQYGGMLAGRVDGNIVNCTVELNDMNLNNIAALQTNPMYFGGMVGYCKGSISNSAVYASLGHGLDIGFLKASNGSSMGGLAGKVEGDINNCYTRVTKLYNLALTPKPTAGALAGSCLGTVKNSHYISGYTVTNCTESASAGTARADFTGLGSALNTVATANSWEQWTEKTTGSGTTAKVEKVYQFKYRKPD
ncbi:MAG: fimbrillin family protein [Prevotella sp.]|nr:fimbrillin family protein [Prevotella sp.]